VRGVLAVGGVPAAVPLPPPPGPKKTSETKIVVLAVVLVVVVIAAGVGLLVYLTLSTPLQGGGPPGQAPAVVATIQASASGVWDATLAVSRSTSLSSFRITVVNETTGAILIPETDLTATFTRTAGGVTVSYRDLAGSGQNQMNTGDAIRVSGVVANNHYSVNLVWRPTGAIVYSFVVPPA